MLPDFGKGIEEKNQILKGVFTEFLFKNMNQIDDDILDTIINSFDFINVSKTLLEAIHTGSVIMVLNPRNLGDILIPTVDIEMQNEIAELYVKAKKQYKAAVEKAEKEFSEAMKNIYQKLDFK